MTNSRLLLAFMASLWAAHAAQAHHIWILPEQPAEGLARVVFSDYLVPDKPELLRKIAHTRLWARDEAGRERQIAWQQDEATYLLDLTRGRSQTIGGSCVYGIETYDHREWKQVPPYLLVYHPKAIVGSPAAAGPWKKLELEIVPTIRGDEVRLQVLFQGQPASRAEMYVHPPVGKRLSIATDDEGIATYRIGEAGLHGFRTRAIEQKIGAHEQQDYGEIRHYASLVMALGGTSAAVGE